MPFLRGIRCCCAAGVPAEEVALPGVSAGFHCDDGHRVAWLEGWAGQVGRGRPVACRPPGGDGPAPRCVSAHCSADGQSFGGGGRAPWRSAAGGSLVAAPHPGCRADPPCSGDDLRWGRPHHRLDGGAAHGDRGAAEPASRDHSKADSRHGRPVGAACAADPERLGRTRVHPPRHGERPVGVPAGGGSAVAPRPYRAVRSGSGVPPAALRAGRRHLPEAGSGGILADVLVRRPRERRAAPRGFLPCRLHSAGLPGPGRAGVGAAIPAPGDA